MIQVYTGNGKGKTTASLGLALRAAGAGLKVYIGQFIKKGCYSEIKILKKIKNITIEQFGRGCFINRKPNKKDMESANKGLEKVRKAILDNRYDLIILDEINVALHFKLIELNDVLDIIKSTPKKTEMVLTGRHAHDKIIKSADLVSYIEDKKHYYNKNLKARKGIEY
ncbi:MAG: cob(I)yrinic acid a,c-diamide adenosyltransferase [Candidatus Omnitrophota bacterium]